MLLIELSLLSGMAFIQTISEYNTNVEPPLNLLYHLPNNHHSNSMLQTLCTSNSAFWYFTPFSFPLTALSA